MKHTTCTTCGDPHFKSGLCAYHYNKRGRCGLNRRVSSAPVAAHITKLRESGWTYKQIAEAAGIAPAHPPKIGRDFDTVTQPTAARILRIPVEFKVSNQKTDAPGARRRLQALAVMGWPQNEVKRRAGVGANAKSIKGGHITVATAEKIRAIYEELWDVQGPSSHTAAIARNQGWVGPMAWDDIDTDEAPYVADGTESVDEVLVQRFFAGGVKPGKLNPVEQIEVMRRLVAKGATQTQVCRHLGWSNARAKRAMAA